VDDARRHDHRVPRRDRLDLLAEEHHGVAVDDREDVEVIVMVRGQAPTRGKVDAVERRLVGSARRRGERRHRVPAQVEGGMVLGAFDRHPASSMLVTASGEDASWHRRPRRREPVLR
jgi:hypothetical protein